ncbi:glycine cleavage system protein GcvH [Oleiharenicola lentus]|uniref:glycine cleavage system protein GcvH n=1 Tax=Oleiharenicola lentus TaxID=2508720 RepID=UPI003F67F911
MNIPPDLKYAPTHEWSKLNPDGTVTIGITDYAQSSLGDITFVQLPKAGTVLTANQPFGVIESVKAASDVYAPMTGTVVAANPLVEATPETVNRSPYDEGWLLTLKVSDPLALRRLMSAEDYFNQVR